MTPIQKRHVARSPKQDTPIVLIPPFVSVADQEDGLIKTVDLESDIIVEFPIWSEAQIGDRYQLRLNDFEVGTVEILEAVPPIGTTLSLSIPVAEELKQDGAYNLDYLVTGYPGGISKASYPLVIIVDRTPPGSHELGRIDFPSEAKDGLTAEELRNMGDILTGSIFGYSGLQRGDIIQTYWGAVPGPEISLTGDEDESTPINAEFSKDFLMGLPSPAGATYYTVTDRAGNTSADSNKITIPLFLNEVIPGLPAPVIDDSDGVIDYREALAGVEVLIPGSTLVEEGDEIVLHWGDEKLGPVPVRPEDIGSPVILIFNVPYATIEAAQNGQRLIKYDVMRNGHPIGVSDDLEIKVHITLPVPGLMDQPVIRGGSSLPSNEDNLIDENDFELNATVLINWNIGFRASQKINVLWGGKEVLEQPYIITNSDVVSGRALLLTALNSKIREVGTGQDIRVFYTVEAIDNPNISTSAEQSIVVRSKEELPGGPDGADAPVFTSVGENNTINTVNSAAGAPVFIKPYINIEAGQTIVFTYEAYDSLVSGNKLFDWQHTSPELTVDETVNGYHLLVPRSILNTHRYGHVEASYQIRSNKGQGNSKRKDVYIDMRF